MGDNFSLIAVVLLSIVLGGAFGWISLYIYAALLSWSGKWLDGRGDTESILRIISYAMIPSIVGLLLVIPQIAMFGNWIFQSDSDFPGNGQLAKTVLYISSFFEIILGLWSMVLLVVGISEVQKISIGKSIVNIITPIAVIIVLIVMIVLISYILS